MPLTENRKLTILVIIVAIFSLIITLSLLKNLRNPSSTDEGGTSTPNIQRVLTAEVRDLQVNTSVGKATITGITGDPRSIYKFDLTLVEELAADEALYVWVRDNRGFTGGLGQVVVGEDRRQISFEGKGLKPENGWSLLITEQSAVEGESFVAGPIKYHGKIYSQ